jgi:hypothetical protein
MYDQLAVMVCDGLEKPLRVIEEELAADHSPDEMFPSITGGVPAARAQKYVPPPSRAGKAGAAGNESRTVKKRHAVQRE